MPDFTFTREDALPTTPVRRWDANVEALKTLKQIEAEERTAIPAEQAVLARYSGFGDSAFEQGFLPYTRDDAWKKRGEELRELTTQDEYESIGRSRLNAFYTTPEVIKAMWDGLERMGAGDLENPRVLEPSAGSGRFLGMQPTEMAKRSERTAVELDELTGRILRRAYPDTKVMITGYQKAPIPDESIDIAISNVPFGNFGVIDPAYKDKPYLTNSIHNYFFAKTLEKLRPGGVMGFVTSHYTMDAPGAKRVREYLAERADLVGAIRLPQDAFPDTQVVADILYFRKRLPEEAPGNLDWVNAGSVSLPNRYGGEVQYPVNQYFLDNPHAVLGKHSGSGSMYGTNQYTVESVPDHPLSDALPQTIRRVSSEAQKMQPYAVPQEAAPAFQLSSKPEGKYFIDDGSLKQVSGGREVETSFRSKNDEARVRAMMDIRDDARRLLDMERDDAPDDDIASLRETLRGKYTSFVDRYKALNSKYNRNLMQADPDSAFIWGLEKSRKADDDSQREWHGADIFEKRVVGGTVSPALETPEDAFVHTFAATGIVDFERMGQLMGQDPVAVREVLLDQDLIFANPETGRWESADRYLTGEVRGKLEMAQIAASADPRFQRNVVALEEIQPEDIPPGEINASLGAPWIPEKVVNDWIRDRLQPGDRLSNLKYYRYDESLGHWVPDAKIRAHETIMESEWGIPKARAPKILESALLGRPIILTQPAEAGSNKRVNDPEATLAAQQKVKKMQDDFEEWVWQDPERAEQLAAIYNRTHNNLRPRTFDGSHQTFPGMSAEWRRKLREHQRNAIYRVVQDGTALLAHEVGFGKTGVMVGSAMERKRLGLSRKPMFVVPKATHAQFRDQFFEIYPQARILFPEETDLSGKNRREFLARVRTGDWDAIILTMDQFKNIPVRPETEIVWQKRHVHDLREALHSLQESGDTRSPTHKEVEKSLERERQHLAKLQASLSDAADQNGEYFEDLGVDQLYVDEADNYKNLRYVTKMGPVKGLPNSESKRSWDMFLKTQYLQDTLAGIGSPAQSDREGFARRGVVFATGTPVANTIAEAWTMMRYLQLKDLHQRGLHHFDAWARTYGKTTTGVEKTPQGTYRQVARFANFNNLPELSSLLQNVADIRVSSEVPEMLAVQPRLVDRAENAKRIVETAPTYPALRRYMQHLVNRAELMASGGVDPKDDNMLKLSGDARKASLDIRMVKWPYEEPPVPNPQGKLVLAADNVAHVYKEEAADLGTQLIFLDLATPKADDAKEKDDDDEDQESLSQLEQQVLKDAYRVLKRELLEQGIPEEQIAFIHDYKNKQKQLELFEKVRKGQVRVLVGSTGKLGVGVNVQDRAAAIHHIDVPWRPRDIEQREGRIVRQGNKVYGPVIDESTGDVLSPGRGVKIFTYVQESSFDEFMWQAVGLKAKAIKSLLRRNVRERTVEDIDPLVLGAAEARALASGDPRMMRVVELDQSVHVLRLEKAVHDTGQRNAIVQVNELTGQVERQRARLPKLEADAAFAQAVMDKDDEFELVIGKRSHDKRTDADAALKEAMMKLPFKGEWQKVGDYQGLNVMASKTDLGHRIALLNPATEMFHESNNIENLNGSNVVTRVNNVLKGMTNAAYDLRMKLGQSEQSLGFYQQAAGKEFDNQSELQQAQMELARLRHEIEGVDDSADAPTGPAYEVEAETETSAIIDDSDDESYATARQKVAGELIAAMQSGGRDFVMPTQAEIDERTAQELRDSAPVEVVIASDAPPEIAAVLEADIPVAAADKLYAYPDDEPTARDVVDDFNAGPTGPIIITNDPASRELSNLTLEQVIDDADATEPTPSDVAPATNAEPANQLPVPAVWELDTGAGDESVAATPESPPPPEPELADQSADPNGDSNVIQQFNDRFGDIPPGDKDKILQAITQEIPAMVAADEAYRNAVAFSDLQNTRVEHDHALQRAVTSLVTTNTALFKEFNDNPAFHDWLTSVNFAATYERMTDRKNQVKDGTIITNDDPPEPAPAAPAPVVTDEPQIVEPVVTDASTLLVEPLPASQPLDPAVAERAAALEQEIALCRIQGEAAKQQHTNPTIAVAEVRADIKEAKAKLDALSDAVGLPDPNTLPDNVYRLELRADGSVKAVAEPADSGDSSDDTTGIPESKPATVNSPIEIREPDPRAEPTPKRNTDPAPDATPREVAPVDTGRAWKDLTHDEKAAAVAEYNKALSALRTLEDVAQEIEETNNVAWAWEARCAKLEQELSELWRPMPVSPLLAPLAAPAELPGVELTLVEATEEANESTGYT